MSSPPTYTRVVLAARPTGHVNPATDFSVLHDPFPPAPRAGEVLVKLLYVSLDPAMRGWINEARSYMEPVALGATMRAYGLGVVVAAGEGATLQVGDNVAGMFGWAEYAVVPAAEARKLTLPPGVELLDFLGPLGPVGMTAYFGLLDVGQLKKGETLVVSGAAGATGSIVCQIGKARGARVFGIAGGAEKCRWLEEECGVDKAIDYKSPTFHDDVKKYVGKYDVYFDNVGGEMLDFMLTRMNQNARIAMCGGISQYNTDKPAGLHSYLSLISARGTIRGFLVFDYAAQFPAAQAELGAMLVQGSLRRKYHVVDGLARAPEALTLLFSGGNTGKLVVKVADEQAKL